MRPDNGAIDHLDALANPFGLVQGFKQKVPQSGQRPAPELAIDRRPLAKMPMQVAPLRPSAGDPENPIENKAVVFRASSAMRPTHRHERLETGRFVIRHQSPNQARLLPKATLNQNLHLMGILFVNAT
jgi:hypothetical protein